MGIPGAACGLRREVRDVGQRQLVRDGQNIRRRRISSVHENRGQARRRRIRPATDDRLASMRVGVHSKILVMAAEWPALPDGAWRDTYATLHMWTQIAGKISLALTTRTN